MKKMSLGTKIYISAATAGCLIAVAGAFIYFNVSNMKKSEHWVRHTNNVIAQFNSLLSLMIDMETGERGYLMSGDEGFLEPYNNAKSRFEPDLKKLQETVSDNPTQVGRLDQALKLKTKWVEGPLAEEMHARAAYDAGRMDKTTFESIVRAGKGKIIMDEFRKIIGDAVAMEKKLNDERVAASDSVANQTFNWVVFGLGGALVLGFLLLWRTIAAAVSSMKTLAEEMLSASHALNNSASELSTSSQSLASAASEQAASLEETAASLQEITSMTQSTASNAEMSSQATSKSSESARRGQRIVTEMKESMNRISSSNEAVMAQVNDSNAKIGAIVNVIQEIGNKTKVINDIVFQTKLLSFNASVEAARAGEHGKGFAVVAEEVGNLAAMSGGAAQEISALLSQSVTQVQSIVSETQEKVVRLCDVSKKQLEDGSNTVTECVNGLTEIAQHVTQAESLSGQIAQAAREQTSGVEQINKALAQLEQLTQTNSSAAEQASGLSQNLSRQSDELRNAVLKLSEIVGHNAAVAESREDNVVVLKSRQKYAA